MMDGIGPKKIIFCGQGAIPSDPGGRKNVFETKRVLETIFFFFIAT